MSIRIRKADITDTVKIVKYLVLSEGELIKYFTHTYTLDGAEEKLFYLIAKTGNRYSYTNVLISEYKNDLVGALWHFPADVQYDLDKDLLNYNIDIKYYFPKEGVDGSYYLSSLAVDSKYRGLGIGSKLLSYAEKYAISKGYDIVSLLVDKKNPKAKKLYRKLGYQLYSEVVLNNQEFLQLKKYLKSCDS